MIVNKLFVLGASVRCRLRCGMKKTYYVIEILSVIGPALKAVQSGSVHTDYCRAFFLLLSFVNGKRIFLIGR